jgi:hypothetical protein
MIKKVALTAVTVMMVLVLSTGCGLAINGKGAGDGSGPIHDIFSGTPFDYTGVIIDCVPGEGIILSVDGVGEVKVYGIGPATYWEELGIARPAVGDEIRVEGYTVVCDIVSLNIAAKIWVAGEEVDLRDEEGMPLWR